MEANLPKVLIMAGGTGGHVYPALTVAEKLLANNAVVEWLGTRRGIENRLVPQKGLPLHFISITGLRGKGLLRWVIMPWQLMRAIAQAISLIRKIKPDVVLGLGGFASGPGGLAAWLLRLPLIIHEQNAVPGTTNCWLNRVATKSLQAFPNSLRDATTVGNPVREAILNIASPAQRKQNRDEKPRLLILGGSLGALKLNQLVPEALALLSADRRPDVWHQSGDTHFALTQDLYAQQNLSARVNAFIDNMHEAYQWADLIICRAGALTVSEVSAVGVAAVFVPFPFAIDDHQTKNAQFLVNAGAAKIIQESELTAKVLADVLRELLSDRSRLLVMAENGRAVSTRDAADKVAATCLEFAHG